MSFSSAAAVKEKKKTWKRKVNKGKTGIWFAVMTSWGWPHACSSLALLLLLLWLSGRCLKLISIWTAPCSSCLLFICQLLSCLHATAGETPVWARQEYTGVFLVGRNFRHGNQVIWNGDTIVHAVTPPTTFIRSSILLSNWVKAWKLPSSLRMFPHGRSRETRPPSHRTS